MSWISYPPPSSPFSRPRHRIPRPRRDARVRPLVGSGKTTGVTIGTIGKAGAGGYQSLSDEEIMARATAQADAQLGVESNAVRTAQALAARQAAIDEGTMGHLGEAQMNLLAPIPQQLMDIRSTAAKDIAGFGAGYTGAMGDQLRAEQAANAQGVSEQTGGTAPGAPTVDPNAVQNAAYAVGGAIPATAQEQIGQASANAAAGMPAVVARSTQLDIQQRMAQAASTDADYRAQLMDLYAKRPGLVQDAVNMLQDIEAKHFDQWTKTQDLSQNQQQIDIQRRAELANEAALGNKKAMFQLQEEDRRANIAIKKQNLKLANQKQAFAVQQAIGKGTQIDAAASKVVGYVVDQNNQPVLDENGNQIPVAQTPGKGPNQKASQDALSMRQQRNPVPYTGIAIPGQTGKYVTAPWARNIKGPNMFAAGPNNPATTNNPNYAQQDGMAFQQAQSYLMSTYGLTKAQARKALLAAGWNPSRDR